MNYNGQRAIRHESWRSNNHRARIPELLISALLLIAGCGNNIVERSASDYFPYVAGNWWRYSNTSSYEPKTVLVEVEPVDTILQVECCPVTYSGVATYYALGNDGIREYVKIVHAFSGADYTVLEGFVKRIATPLVTGNVYSDSLTDSVDVAGAWIKGRYDARGVVSEYRDDGLYGNVYKVVLSFRETVTDPETTIVRELNQTEYYAPGIGLVRYDNEAGEFHLSDYGLQ